MFSCLCKQDVQTYITITELLWGSLGKRKKKQCLHTPLLTKLYNRNIYKVRHILQP